MSEPFWAIAYYGCNHNPRARRWYRISRMIEVDGSVFELYWHPDIALRGNSRDKIKAQAALANIPLCPDIYCEATAPRRGNSMVRT